MKRLLLTITALMLCFLATAQTQQGYVKTKGRMVDGKLVPGHGLKGATVCIKGRTAVLVNSDNGVFSFPTPEAQFRLDSVRKKGYRLVDMDACPKTYKYSSNPLYIVMETPEQQLQDKLNAEKKIRRNLQKQLQEKENEIAALKEKDKISLDDYHKSLQQLYDEQESNEQLISDMARRYSQLDYDQLDEFYRQVSYCIENGELVKADSLLNTKGDVAQQVNEQLKKGQAIKEQEAQLNQAKTVHAADQEELARRCYSYFETYAARHLNDTAAYFLELRASLDTTNIDWQSEAGIYIEQYIADYDKSMTYYQRALRQALLQYDERHLVVANCYANLGSLHYEINDYPKSMECYEMAMDILKSTVGEHHKEVAECYNSIGLIYDSQGDYAKALEYDERALDITKSIYGTTPLELTTYYNNIGTIYTAIGDTAKALEYLNLALSIRESQLDKGNLDLAYSYNNIGIVYEQSNDFEKAMYYYGKELEVLQIAVGERHPFTAANYNNIGVVFEKQGNLEKALEYYERALSIRKSILGEQHSLMAYSYYNIGNIYRKQGNYAEALEYHTKALRIRKALFGESHPDVGTSYNEIGYIYFLLNDYAKTLEFFQNASKSWKAVFGEGHPYVALSYNNIGHAYFYLEDYPNSLEQYQKSYNLYKSIYDEDYSECIKIKDRIEKVKEKMAEAPSKESENK